MRNYNPQTHREDTIKRSVQRAADRLAVERAADPGAYKARTDALNAKAREYQERAMGKRR